MTATTHHTPTIYDIKPGDVVSIPAYKGEQTITVRKTFEHDSAMHLTDETGWEHTVYESQPFRFVHRA